MSVCSSHTQCPAGQRCAAIGTAAALCVPGRPNNHFEDDADRACASGTRGHMNLEIDSRWRGRGAPELMERCCPGPIERVYVMDSDRYPRFAGRDYRFCADLPRGDPCTVHAQCAGADRCVHAGLPDATCGPPREPGDKINSGDGAECRFGKAGYWSPADEAAQIRRCCPAISGYDARGRCTNLPWPEGAGLADGAGVRLLDSFGDTAVFAERYHGQLGRFNDNVREVEVAPGCTVRLYEHHGGGKWADLGPGRHRARRWDDAAGFNTDVTSMRVDCGDAGPAAPAKGSGIRVHTADGKAAVFLTGAHQDLRDFNDRIERVDVAPGCSAELFQHHDLTGDRGTLSLPGSYLGKRQYGAGLFRTNDVSSLRVSCGDGAAAVLNPGGPGETSVSPGFYQHLNSVGLNDKISAVTVRAGCSVRLYDHGNAEGASGDLVAGGADRRFDGASTWGNGRFIAGKATSMIAACGEPLPPANCKGVDRYPNLGRPGPCCTGKSELDEDGDQQCIS